MPVQNEMMRTGKRQNLAIGLVVLTGVCASFLMFWILANGPGVSPDSVAYIETARSLLAGHGFFALGQPMTRYAPGYPLLLAMVGVSQHGDVLQAGRLLCAILFGTNVVLLGLTVFICTKRNLLAAGLAMGLFLASAPIVSTHSMAWSEAPFILFTLAAFILLSFHIAHPRIGLLLAASLFAACAIATRYIGVTLLPPMVIALLFFGNRPVKQKIFDTLLLVILALIPLATWMIRNTLIAETAVNRSLVFHMAGPYHIKQLIITMINFVLPLSKLGWMEALQQNLTKAVLLVTLGIGLVLFLGLLALIKKKSIKPNEYTTNGILSIIYFLFFVTYIVFLMISISFFDASTPLNDRILLPAFLAIMIVLISLVWSLSAALDKRIVWYGFILIMLFPIFINGAEALAVMQDIHKNGSGYTSTEWKNSPTVAAVALLSKDMKIYSNGYDAIQFLLGRTVTVLPPVANLETSTSTQDFDNQLQGMCKEVEEGTAAVVYLNSIGWRGFLPTLEELDEKCTMPVLDRFVDGVIYGR